VAWEPFGRRAHTTNMHKSAIRLALSLLVLSGCKEPRLSYDVRADLKAPGLEAVCLDPRTDLAVVLEGKRILNPGPVKELVMQALLDKGFRVVPPGQAAVWVNVLFLTGASGRDRGAQSAKGGGPAMGDRGSRGGMGGSGGSGSRRSRNEAGTPATGESSGAHGGGDLTVLVRLLHPGDAELLWLGQLVVQPRKSSGSATARSLEQEVADLLAPLPKRLH
jgi:hypothetical protein